MSGTPRGQVSCWYQGLMFSTVSGGKTAFSTVRRLLLGALEETEEVAGQGPSGVPVTREGPFREQVANTDFT